MIWAFIPGKKPGVRRHIYLALVLSYSFKLQLRQQDLRAEEYITNISMSIQNRGMPVFSIVSTKWDNGPNTTLAVAIDSKIQWTMSELCQTASNESKL